MVTPIITYYDNHSLKLTNRIFSKQIKSSYDEFPDFMKRSYAYDIISYYEGQEDEWHSIQWVHLHQKCVVDQLSTSELNCILKRIQDIAPIPHATIFFF